MEKDTKCVHNSKKNKTHSTGSVTMPIFQSATFAHKGIGKSTGYDYARLKTPTSDELEQVMANIEGAETAISFSSGMAAVSTLFTSFLENGDEIICSDDLYGGIVRLLDEVISKNGIKVIYVDVEDLNNIKKNINKNTKMIFVETVTNPMMKVCDLKGIKKIIAGKNILFVCDNTFLTPYYCKPLELGADIVVHSATKYLNGHNDVLAGFLLVNKQKLAERILYIHKTIGSTLSPFDSYLLIRGLKTLALRMDKVSNNALKIANYLKTNKNVKKVLYVGLKEHKGHKLHKNQSSGDSGMITFYVKDVKVAKNLLSKVKLISFAESLGGVETLITYPITQTHAEVPEKVREKLGINECLIRLSVGIENHKDIIDDLKNALS